MKLIAFCTERCLDKDEKPSDLLKEWEADKKAKVAPCFLFKKKIFLKDDEREMQDPVAKDLVYIQAVSEAMWLHLSALAECVGIGA